MAAAACAVFLLPAEIDQLGGRHWAGHLTYKDYSSGKLVTIPSTLRVKSAGADSWSFAISYPNEPHANNESMVTLTSGGTVFDGEHVIAKSNLANGGVQFVTTKDGADDGRPTQLQYSYMISRNRFSITKFVRTEPTKKLMFRNRYEWFR